MDRFTAPRRRRWPGSGTCMGRRRRWRNMHPAFWPIPGRPMDWSRRCCRPWWTAWVRRRRLGTGRPRAATRPSCGASALTWRPIQIGRCTCPRSARRSVSPVARCEPAAGSTLGMGPLRYLWLRRMEQARRALAISDPATVTVTEIATRYAFWELAASRWPIGRVRRIAVGGAPPFPRRHRRGLASHGPRTAPSGKKYDENA